MSKKVKKDILTTHNSLTYSYFKIEGSENTIQYNKD